MPWIQVYDPLGNPWLSTAAAALPIVLLLVTLGVLEWKAHWAALDRARVGARGLGGRLRHAGVDAPSATAIYGAAYGLLPIGWIIVNAVFLYNLTVETGQFEIVKASVANLSADRRIQALLIAFSFGAFIEGAVRVRHAGRDLLGAADGPGIHAALRRRSGAHRQHRAGCVRRDRHADPHARGRHRTAGDDAERDGRPPTAVRVADRPGMAGRDDERVARVWRACGRRCSCRGGVFAIAQFAWSNYVGPELVDIVGGLLSLGALTWFCRVWKPREVWLFPEERERGGTAGRPLQRRVPPSAGRGVAVAAPAIARPALVRAWMPWVFLSVMVILWGLPSMKALLNGGPDGLRRVPRRTSGCRQHGDVADLGRAAAPPVCVPRLPGRSQRRSTARGSTMARIATRGRRRRATSSTGCRRPARAS